MDGIAEPLDDGMEDDDDDLQKILLALKKVSGVFPWESQAFPSTSSSFRLAVQRTRSAVRKYPLDFRRNPI
jgi:hypothetical protein